MSAPPAVPAADARTVGGRLPRLLVGRARLRPPDLADPSPAAPPWSWRAPVRIGFLVVLAVAVLAGAGLVGVLVRSLLSMALGPVAAGLVADLLAVVVAIGLYVLLVRMVERRTVSELAPTGAAAGLVRGVVLGVGLFAAVIAVIALLGGYRVIGPGTLAGAASLLGLAVYSGVVEELVFRGALFRIAEELAGTWVALAVSAVLFGALHLLNPDASLWGATAIAIEAGILLGAAYAVTRSLWFPIGLHLAWNFTQGGIFGVPISGSGVGADGLVRSTLSGPVALSGGSFGAEASLPAVVFCLAAGVVLLALAARSGQIRPPRGRRGSALLAHDPAAGEE